MPELMPKPSRITLRPADPVDIPALSDLIRLSVRCLSPDYSPAVIEASLIHAFGVDTNLINDGTYFAAEAAAPEPGGTPTLVGCGGWSFRRKLYGNDHVPSDSPHLLDGKSDTLDPATEPARIRAFFVHPEWTRRGIGSLLMRHCEVAARAAGFTRLELGATLPGVPLYKAHGFAAQEAFDYPLPNGLSLPLVRMAKQL